MTAAERILDHMRAHPETPMTAVQLGRVVGVSTGGARHAITALHQAGRIRLADERTFLRGDQWVLSADAG